MAGQAGAHQKHSLGLEGLGFRVHGLKGSSVEQQGIVECIVLC